MAAPAEGAGGGFEYNGPNYVRETDRIVDFLQTPKYKAMLQEVANRERDTVDVSLDDLRAFDDVTPRQDGDEDMVMAVATNARRYVDLFSAAIDKELPETRRDLTEDDDVADVLAAHRLAQLEEAQRAAREAGQADDPQNGLPPQLMRRYEVHFKPAVKSKFLPLREVSAPSIGSLVSVKAIVTRVSDVKPLVTVLTYTCDDCGMEVYQTVNGREFMPLSECPGTCAQNGRTGRLHMQTRGSKFVKFQEIRVQELPEQVPVGNIPRSMTCIARGSMCRRAGPGDVVTVSGIFLPTPFTGFKALRAGLITDTYLEVQEIQRVKKTYSELTLTDEMKEQIEDASRDGSIYSKLARSLAPEIYGHVDIKKALLLQLVGGVTKEMADGMRIRGDINVCLMGDPGVAKSQLLKHITSVAPRGVYTTGKGSSGVGLTAAVLRDPMTKELTLEGGALVMADKGICCIDEFDKMEDSDRTAIHEVMEQQTVSIAKAGITTTLNARTAILAAANPLYGRYNRRLTPTENINLPAALLSRFDLMFLILDKANADGDLALAHHVTYVHQNGKHPELDFDPLDSHFIRAYIAEARKVEPVVPTEVSSDLVESYVDMRATEAREAAHNNEQSVMTARRLLSILRLSQALARLRFSTRVASDDVKEAIRLVHMSKASLIDDGGMAAPEDVVSRIFTMMRDLAVKRDTLELSYGEVEAMAAHKGFSKEKLTECLEEYSDIGVLMVDSDRTTISFVDPE